VLARSSAGMADSTIRGELSTLEQIRDWFGRPLWEMEPSVRTPTWARAARGAERDPSNTAAQERVQAGLVEITARNSAASSACRMRPTATPPPARGSLSLPDVLLQRRLPQQDPAGRRGASAGAHGRPFEVDRDRRGVSPGPAATAASRRTCGGWAETGLGQPWSSWPSAREAGPSRPTGVRVDERAVDVEVGTVKACRHGGSLPCCSSGSAPPPASHPSTRSRKNRGSRQASTPPPTSEAIGWETAR
jgi:hypothetical protein